MDDDDLLDEYDFAGGERGRYHQPLRLPADFAEWAMRKTSEMEDEGDCSVGSPEAFRPWLLFRLVCVLRTWIVLTSAEVRDRD